jgi:hypothetical protein
MSLWAKMRCHDCTHGRYMHGHAASYNEPYGYGRCRDVSCRCAEFDEHDRKVGNGSPEG